MTKNLVISLQILTVEKFVSEEKIRIVLTLGLEMAGLLMNSYIFI